MINYLNWWLFYLLIIELENEGEYFGCLFKRMFSGRVLARDKFQNLPHLILGWPILSSYFFTFSSAVILGLTPRF